MLQHPPEGQGVGLDAVGAADDQHRAIQYRHHSFRFRGKIHMPRGIHQGQGQLFRGKQGLLGENGDAPLPFQIVGVQKCVAVIHPSPGPTGTGAVQQSFGKGGLARVHMGHKADTAIYLFCRSRHNTLPPDLKM